MITRKKEEKSMPEYQNPIFFLSLQIQKINQFKYGNIIIFRHDWVTANHYYRIRDFTSFWRKKNSGTNERHWKRR